MKKYLFILLTLSVAFFGCEQKKSTEASAGPATYVDPFIGTNYFGNTFPGATLPFAMVQLSPDTYDDGWSYAAGYKWPDSSIMGFTHRHLSGVGMVALGDILVMPTVDTKTRTIPGTRENPDEGYRSRFDHEHEIATPGYYCVLLKDYNVKAEFTVTKRVGFHKYTFPETKNAHIIFDMGHILGKQSDEPSHIEIVNDTTVQGYKTSPQGIVYFVAVFSKQFSSYGTWNKEYKKPELGGGTMNPYKTAETGIKVGAFLDYTTTKDEVVMIKVAISTVSIEGAGKNLAAELPGWDFDKVRKDAEKTWNHHLKKIKIKGGTKEQKRVFYTALYHTLLAQQIGNDVDGKYYGMDGKIHVAKGYDFFPTFSAWDTYRSEHPLMTIIETERSNEMIKSIIDKTRNHGWLPAQHFNNLFRPSMVGDHLVPIVVDAYVKGIRDYDINYIYEMMKKKAIENAPAGFDPANDRPGLEFYEKHGYIPVDRDDESVAATLEFAYDDWCIAQLAKELGKDDDYRYFSNRALNYRNVYDKQTGFMRPRMSDGSWLRLCKKGELPKPAFNGDHSYYGCFDPLFIGTRPNRHYAESNAWHYLWSVQHDVPGLINLMGGKDAFVKKLDEFFTMSPEITGPNYVGVVGTIGQYVHGNQPSHHVAYMYDYAGEPWKTQMRVNQVMNQLYHDNQGGIPGNDDMGSLSSWFVLSAMGFYEIAPGNGIYTIGTPLFKEVKVNLENGKVFTVIAKNRTKENLYIQSATLNGKPLNKPFLKHEDIMNGSTLVFEMGPEPNKNWGVE